MITATFGKPETAGVKHADPTLLEHAEIVNRAIHTLSLLGEYGAIEDDDSIISLFVAQSKDDLRRLMAFYEAQGINVKDLEP